MIWNDERIAGWASSGGVSPLNSNHINPASIDLSWSGRWRIARRGGLKIDEHNSFVYVEQGWSDISDEDYLDLHPNCFYLLDTLEYVKIPLDAVGKLFLKSSAGRMGIEHLHAGYVDPGFSGTLTLEIEIRVPWSVRIERGQRLVQLTLEQMIAPAVHPYSEVGRYQDQRVPTQSKGLPK